MIVVGRLRRLYAYCTWAPAPLVELDSRWRLSQTHVAVPVPSVIAIRWPSLS